jgi:hypothetical protein
VFTTLVGDARVYRDERTSRRVFFSATRRPVVLSLALYTFPYVPCPIFSSFSYASLMEWPMFAVFDVEAP